MERLWKDVSARMDGFFFNRSMKKYLNVANRMKVLVDDYLFRHSYRFISEVRPEPELDWPKVSINVKVSVASYSFVLKVWEEVCNYVYPVFGVDETCGVFLAFDLLE